jgi:hypothetical protein
VILVSSAVLTAHCHGLSEIHPHPTPEKVIAHSAGMRLTLRSRKSYDGCETGTRCAPVEVRKVNRWRTLGQVRCERLPRRFQ